MSALRIFHIPARTIWGAGLLVLLLLAPACQRPSEAGEGLALATTTSYLEAAVRDLLGDQVRVVRLAEPGTCPGHFDVRPSQVQELRRCAVVLRFDFQKSLDSRLADAGTNRPHAAEISIRGGMGQPDSYIAVCRQAANHLVGLKLLAQTNAESRLRSISNRLDALSRVATNRVRQAGLVGASVITSVHQRDFCQWLGLNVVAAFRAADTASISEIQEAIDAGRLAQIRFVIGNLPEGRRTSDALAERLKTRVIVFENFPALKDGRVSFDEMLSANTEALLRGATP
jgi:zinc transport system substrate-binding protein